MAIEANDIMPAAPAAAAPAPAAQDEETPKEAKGGEELPEALLKEAPALQLLMNGSPPATFAPTDAEFPELKTVAKHIKDLGKAGFGVYGTKDGSNVVVFNGLYITPDEVKAADEAGQLDAVAAPYAELRTALQGGAEGTTATEASPDASGAIPTPAALPAASAGPAAPAATQNKIASKRLANVSLGSPTSGPAPGQGRILNNIAKPVV